MNEKLIELVDNIISAEVNLYAQHKMFKERTREFEEDPEIDLCTADAPSVHVYLGLQILANHYGKQIHNQVVKTPNVEYEEYSIEVRGVRVFQIEEIGKELK